MSNTDKPLIDQTNPDAAVPGRVNKTGSRRHWKTIDWGKAAELIAQGGTVEAVAAMLGCEAERILRNLRRSARFRHRIDRAADRLQLSARLRFAALGDAATREMRRRTVQGQDPRLLQWLGEKSRETMSRPRWASSWPRPRARRSAANRRKCWSKRAETGRNGPERDETGCNRPRMGRNWPSNRPKRDGPGHWMHCDKRASPPCGAARCAANTRMLTKRGFRAGGAVKKL